MDEYREWALETLRLLASRPATPFFESGPARHIRETLGGIEVPSQLDRYGNIIAHYAGSPRAGTPPIAFVAHMDHPGFEITEVTKSGPVARAMGGVPVASLRSPTPVLVLTEGDHRLAAQTAPLDCSSGREESDRRVMVQVEFGSIPEPPVPVVFDLPDFEMDGDTIRMRAADDLAGCAAILTALYRLVSGGSEAEIYAVFTRAEEVGLYGARLIAETGTLPRETIVVSVEASSVIPGVAQGAGPVIRTGDASYTFDADAEQVLVAAREAIRKRDPEFRCQRHLMSGGTCEATAFAVFGYRTTGVAFPLGNYHNATSRISDPNGGVDAEYIRVSDFLGGIELLTEAANSLELRDSSPTRRRLRQVPDEIQTRLEATAGS